MAKATAGPAAAELLRCNAKVIRRPKAYCSCASGVKASESGRVNAIQIQIAWTRSVPGSSTGSAGSIRPP